MEEKNEDRQVVDQTKSSRELLYSDYTGTSVTEHVFGFLEKNNQSTRKMEISKFINDKGGKSGALERVKKLLSTVDNGQNGSCLEASSDDEEAIDVELMINGHDSNPDAEECNADAFFMLSKPQMQVGESDSSYSDSSDSDSSDSDDGSWLNFSSSKRKNLIEVIDDDCVAENDSLSISESNSLDSPACKSNKGSFVSIRSKRRLTDMIEEDSSNSNSDSRHEKNLNSSDKNKYSNEKAKSSGIPKDKSLKLSNNASPAAVSTANEVQDKVTDNNGNKNLEFSSNDCQQNFTYTFTNKNKLIDVMKSEIYQPYESPLKKSRRQV